MNLARRLALLAALLALVLILGTTELTLVWSSRARLAELRNESIALAETWAEYLARVAARGDTASIRGALVHWPDEHITATSASVFVAGSGGLQLAATSDSSFRAVAAPQDLDAFTRASMVVWRDESPRPAWRVALPIGAGRPWCLLSVEVSVETLETWARVERRRAYAIAAVAAVLLGLGVGALVTRWVGRPLGALDSSMAIAHGGLEGAPPAPETGAGEFRRLARRYNEMLQALGNRRRESDAQSARLALEERARGIERAALAEETAATFAHEIGTPLNTISGHLQLLRDDLALGKNHPGVERVNTVLSQVDRVSAIVRARLERGRWPAIEIGEADLTEIGSRLASFMEPSARQAGVRVELAGAAAARCWCDPVLVEQILLNLMKNAIEAMPSGGALRLSAGTTEGTAWLDVSDTGPGLPPAARARLFQPFTTTKGAEGTGLGLAVSQRLAQGMGGNLELRDSAKGTAWRLTLPAVAGNGPRA